MAFLKKVVGNVSNALANEISMKTAKDKREELVTVFQNRISACKLLEFDTTVVEAKANAMNDWDIYWRGQRLNDDKSLKDAVDIHRGRLDERMGNVAGTVKITREFNEQLTLIKVSTEDRAKNVSTTVNNLADFDRQCDTIRIEGRQRLTAWASKPEAPTHTSLEQMIADSIEKPISDIRSAFIATATESLRKKEETLRAAATTAATRLEASNIAVDEHSQQLREAQRQWDWAKVEKHKASEELRVATAAFQQAQSRVGTTEKDLEATSGKFNAATTQGSKLVEVQATVKKELETLQNDLERVKQDLSKFSV